MTTITNDFVTIENIIRHEIHRRKKQNKRLKKNEEKKKQSTGNRVSSTNTEEYTKTCNTSTQLSTTLHNKKAKKVYTMICGNNDKCLNKDKTEATNLDKNELINFIPSFNASEGDKELALFKKKKKEDKKKVQNNNNLKTNKTVSKTQKQYTETIDGKHLNNDKTEVSNSNKDELNRRISMSTGDPIYANYIFKKKKKKKKGDKKMVLNDDNSTNNLATSKVEKSYNDTCYENDKHFNKDKTRDSNLNEVLDELTRGIPITNALTDDSLKSQLKKNKKKSKALSSQKVMFISNDYIGEDGGGKELELFDSRDSCISKDRTMTDTGMSFGQYNNQTSNNPNSVKGHENVLSGKTPLQCGFCFKMFIKKFQLNKHRRTHNGEKPYVCNVCGRSFSQKVNLVRHNRTHTGEKPYACNYCGQLFSQKENLGAHIRIHTGEIPYACNICGQSFSRQHHLDRHINRTHTVKKPETCKVCDQSFSKKGDLVIHYRTHVGEKPFDCGQCEKKFSTNGNLKRHIQFNHTK